MTSHNDNPFENVIGRGDFVQTRVIMRTGPDGRATKVTDWLRKTDEVVARQDELVEALNRRHADTVDLGIEREERQVWGSVYGDVEAILELAKGGDDVDARDLVDALRTALAADRYRRDAQAPEGYCRHGVYVGGCGVDWMCGACEDGAE